MKSAIDKIKGALATKDLGAFFNHYLIANNEIVATDGRITAGIPFDTALQALVPGPELEALVGRLDAPIAVTAVLGPNNDPTSPRQPGIKLQSGRMHGVIETLPPESAMFPRPEGDWSPAPDGLVEALRRARPFVADMAIQPWALCACLRSDEILASNNITLVKSDCAGLDTPCDILLPRWAVDFIISTKSKLTHTVFNANHAGFLFDDGLWLRSQLVEGIFPEAASNILENLGASNVPVTDEWRKAYMALADVSENIVTIMSEKMIGGKGRARVEHETPMDGLAEPIHFNPKFLNGVVDVMTSWGPSFYPRPIPWRGDGICGIVMGRSA